MRTIETYTQTISFKLSGSADHTADLREMGELLMQMPGAAKVNINWMPKRFRLHVAVTLAGTHAFVLRATELVVESVGH